MDDSTPVRFALVGPGRAGRAVAVRLVTVGSCCSAVAGRTTASESAADAARRLAAGVRPGALVVHLAGALGVDALAPLAARRPDVELGALHPLQTLTGFDDGDALVGAWAAV